MPTMLDGSKHTLETGCLPNQSSGHIPTQSTGFMPNQSTGFMPNQFTSCMPTPKENMNTSEDISKNKTSAFKDTEDEEEELLYAPSTDAQCQRVMAYEWEQGKGPLLPKIFRLTNPYPGEPPFMKLRTKPAVLRFHKFKAENDLEAYWFFRSNALPPLHM